jgi:hypothetical protein
VATGLEAPIRTFALSLLATLLALLLGEGVLRLAGQSYYWAVAKQPDASLGWRPGAGISAWQRLEGAALVQTNARGFRDRDHDAEERPPGLVPVRVVVLGDSFAEAVQVPLEQTWWRLMEAELNAGACAPADRPGPPARPFEVLSFAVSGYSTAQSLLAWRHEALVLDPDIVVLALFLGNDLVENSPLLDDEPMRPYLLAAGDDLTLDAAFLSSPEYRFRTSFAGRLLAWVTRHSYLAQTLVQARHVVMLRAEAGAEPPPGEPGVDSGVFRVPDDAAWRDAWRVTERIIAAFAGEVRATGAHPVLMVVGTAGQVHPDPRVVAALAARIGVPDLGYPVRRLLQAADIAGLPVINLPETMAAEAERLGTPLHGFDNAIPGFGHWNAAGHRVAAAAATRAVCAQWSRAIAR